MHHEGGLCKTFRDSFLILLFETIGTALLSCLYNTSLRYMDYCGFLMGTFILFIMSVRISGSHYNPAITVSFMFRRDVGKFSRVLGIAYIIVQFIGAFAGAMLSFLFVGAVGFIGLRDNSAKYIPAAMVAETIGTVLLVFLYLTQTEEKTKLTKDTALSMLILAATYLACIMMTGAPDQYAPPSGIGYAVLNPAIAVGSAFAMMFQGEWSGLEWFWIYLAFPIAGAIIGVIFHEIAFKKMQDSVE